MQAAAGIAEVCTQPAVDFDRFAIETKTEDCGSFSTCKTTDIDDSETLGSAFEIQVHSLSATLFVHLKSTQI